VISARASRQSFLGSGAEQIFRDVRVAILGVGGGGAHVAQQLAHVGLEHVTVCDPDYVEESNLNRLVGAIAEDVRRRARKVDVAARVVLGVNPRAKVTREFARWEDCADRLRHVDLIFGCLDGYAARDHLERFARRFLIPLIDVGVDVDVGPAGVPQMSGQTILSMPGAACMRCMGFLNDVVLGREARQYGAAGVRPQVVWANGMLASCAVGLAVDVLTGWTRSTALPVYLEYDGNLQCVVPSVRLKHLPPTCVHFEADKVGPPRFCAL
jgi:hypothetical protein